MIVLFLKAKIHGGASGDLFSDNVPVAGYTTRDGTFVPPHRATRHKRILVLAAPHTPPAAPDLLIAPHVSPTQISVADVSPTQYVSPAVPEDTAMQERDPADGFAAGTYGEAHLTIGEGGRLILTFPAGHLAKPLAAKLKAADFRQQRDGAWWQTNRKRLIEGQGMVLGPRDEATRAAIQAVLDVFSQAKDTAAAVALGRHGALTVSTKGGGWRLTHDSRFNQGVHDALKRFGGAWANGGWDVPGTVGDKLAAYLKRHAKGQEVSAAAEAEAARAAAVQQQEQAARAKAELDAKRAAVPAQEMIADGTYGPFSVRRRAGDTGYVVGFRYDPAHVAAVKAAGGHGFNPTTKTWNIDRANTGALRSLLDRAVVQANEQIERARAEATRALDAKRAAHQRQAEEDEAAGILRREVFHGDDATFPEPLVVGRMAEFKGRLYRLQSVGKPSRIREDARSFGYDDDSGRIYPTVWKLAEGDEIARYQADQAKARAAAAARKLAASLAARVRSEGQAPGGSHVLDGERLLDTQNIYGGGSWWVVQPDRIWFVQNNGMDGDGWDRNNVRTGGAGGIGWYVPYDPDLLAQLRGADAAIKAGGA